MDGKFRLAFSEVGKTPAADAYVADASSTYERLTDAVKAGHERRTAYELPYISHRFIVLDPTIIGVLYSELHPVTGGGELTRPTSLPKPGTPC